MNIWDIIIILLVAVAFIRALVSIFKNMKSGKCSCGCCSGKCNGKCGRGNLK
ncbi:MAG: FeoB-associated Cys-rich membrane protein [Oscillospiraceae bacterium]|nr:FeoB-associated Cys-rich membrane protein [Oscillospiraceae bacterium]